MTLLQDFAAGQADERPGATALVLEEERLTYGDLEARSNRLARLLRELGCRRGDRVALVLPKSPAAIVAMHAALKADCAYVPVDTASPAPRVGRILRAAEPRVVLTAASASSLVDGLIAEEALGAETAIGAADGDAVSGERFRTAFGAADWEALPDGPLDSLNGPEDAAHILFTSGSTGEPKGVVITHRNVAEFVAWAIGYFGTRPLDRISGHPPLHFDLSTFDVYGSFAAGAELHLVPARLNLMAKELAAFIRRSELTQWFSVPSTLSFMSKFGVVEEGDFPTLERLLWCGEVLPTPVLIDWMRRLPHVQFTNLYGPTEATIASSYFTISALPADETEPIPIGRACAGEELSVLDGALRPVAAGEVGDLYIGGVGLSPGYWRDEGKTREAFLPDPRGGGTIYRTGDLARVDAGGVFHFVGRADSQIKSRGYRIELGEIESALHALAGIRECAIVGVPTQGFEGTAICCAYAAAAGTELTPASIRAALAKTLPSYMLPTRWRSFDGLPKNVNGKIDRSALRRDFTEDDRSPEAGPREPLRSR
ncbi:MAG: amino acid adenylation domain-containing protein [Actinobacteria bacterium]|nr:amino acid adenylation domain-containing protein [Actinomycetota bacterium]